MEDQQQTDAAAQAAEDYAKFNKEATDIANILIEAMPDNLPWDVAYGSAMRVISWIHRNNTMGPAFRAYLIRGLREAAIMMEQDEQHCRTLDASRLALAQKADKSAPGAGSGEVIELPAAAPGAARKA